MTTKADFNAEEWSKILQGPPIAGMMVVAAERGGTVRESLSMAKAYAEARKQHGANELLDEVLSSAPEIDQQRFGSPDQLRQEGPRAIREALELLESKGTAEDANAYRQLVLTLADTVAHAHREGGILGIGGKEVSDSEQAVLDELAAALDGQRDS